MSTRPPDPPVVLVIEDDAILGLAMAATVRSLGGEAVGPATCLDEAIRLASEHPPDLVISDVTLTDGDTGIVAVRAIRTFAEEVPVIFVTGSPEKVDGQAAAALSATVIRKPAEHRDLEAAIATRLRRRRRA